MKDRDAIWQKYLYPYLHRKGFKLRSRLLTPYFSAAVSYRKPINIAKIFQVSHVRADVITHRPQLHLGFEDCSQLGTMLPCSSYFIKVNLARFKGRLFVRFFLLFYISKYYFPPTAT